MRKENLKAKCKEFWDNYEGPKDSFMGFYGRARTHP